MRLSFLLILALFFLGCHSQSKQKKFYFASIGWKISVPAYFITEDSAAYYGQVAKELKGLEKNAAATVPNDGLIDMPSHPDNSPASGSNPNSPRIAGLNRILLSPQKMLLRISDSSGWFYKPSFISNITPIDTNETMESALRQAHDEITGALLQGVVPATKVDTSSSAEKIGNRNFIRQDFVFTRANTIEHYIIYTGFIRNYKLQASISYRETDDISSLLKAWRSSVFEK